MASRSYRRMHRSSEPEYRSKVRGRKHSAVTAFLCPSIVATGIEALAPLFPSRSSSLAATAKIPRRFRSPAPSHSLTTGRTHDFFRAPTTSHANNDPSLAPLYAELPSLESATQVGDRSWPRWYVTYFASSQALARRSADASSSPIVRATFALMVATPSAIASARWDSSSPALRRRSRAMRLPTLSARSPAFSPSPSSSDSPSSSSSSEEEDSAASIRRRYSRASRNRFASAVSSSSSSSLPSPGPPSSDEPPAPWSNSSSSDSTSSSCSVGVTSSSTASSYRPPWPERSIVRGLPPGRGRFLPPPAPPPPPPRAAAGAADLLRGAIIPKQ
ncbi:hypothetical protein ACHAWF_006856 [Thalassiosira exigua]